MILVAGISSSQFNRIVAATEGYSGSDISALCQEAAMGPIREMKPEVLKTIKADEIRSLTEQDFLNAMRIIRPSVSKESLTAFVSWSDKYGVSR